MHATNFMILRNISTQVTILKLCLLGLYYESLQVSSICKLIETIKVKNTFLIEHAFSLDVSWRCYESAFSGDANQILCAITF